MPGLCLLIAFGQVWPHRGAGLPLSETPPSFWRRSGKSPPPPPEGSVGGTFHLKLNIGSRPTANKYHEGKGKSTLKGELKAPGIAEREANRLKAARVQTSRTGGRVVGRPWHAGSPRRPGEGSTRCPTPGNTRSPHTHLSICLSVCLSIY